MHTWWCCHVYTGSINSAHVIGLVGRLVGRRNAPTAKALCFFSSRLAKMQYTRKFELHCLVVNIFYLEHMC